MLNTTLTRVTLDLLSILPLISRTTHRKLLKTSLAELDLNITPLHFEIIRLLEDKGALHVVEIGEILQISKAQTSQLINKLVDMGLVERQTDVQDRRVTNISITTSGRTKLNEYKNIMISSIQDTLAHLSSEELEELSISLKKIQDILNRLP